MLNAMINIANYLKSTTKYKIDILKIIINSHHNLNFRILQISQDQKSQMGLFLWNGESIRYIEGYKWRKMSPSKGQAKRKQSLRERLSPAPHKYYIQNSQKSLKAKALIEAKKLLYIPRDQNARSYPENHRVPFGPKAPKPKGSPISQKREGKPKLHQTTKQKNSK